MGGFGGSGVGAAQALSLLFSAAFLTYWAIILRAYLRAGPSTPGDANRFSWHLFVPCRDEAAVIGATIGYLCATFPAATVWVIDDHSDDDTAAIAAQWCAAKPRVRLVRRRRPDAGTGKGDALNAAYRELRRHLGDQQVLSAVIVGVVDADGRPSPNAFDVCAGPSGFGQPKVAGVQLEVRIANTCERRPLPGRGGVANLLARTLVRMQDIEFRTVIGAIQRSRARSQTVGMGGNGQFTRLSALAALDDGDGRAWRGSLLEDYELGLHLLLAGYATAFTADAWVDQEGLPTLGRYLRQRTRWGQGVMQCLRYLPRAWNSPNLSTIGALETSYYLIQPWLSLAGTIVFPLPLIAVIVNQARVGNTVGDFMAQGGWALVAVYGLLGTAPFWLWGPLYRRRCAPQTGRLTALGWGFAYLIYVYGFYLTSWRAVIRLARGQHGWSKTRRNAEFTPARRPVAQEGPSSGADPVGVGGAGRPARPAWSTLTPAQAVGRAFPDPKRRLSAPISGTSTANHRGKGLTPQVASASAHGPGEESLRNAPPPAPAEPAQAAGRHVFASLALFELIGLHRSAPTAGFRHKARWRPSSPMPRWTSAAVISAWWTKVRLLGQFWNDVRCIAKATLVTQSARLSTPRHVHAHRRRLAAFASRYRSMVNTVSGTPRRLRKGAWVCPGLTDIHHQARSAGKDAHYGDRGEEEAPASQVLHP